MRTSEPRQRSALLTLFALAAFALLITLGVWQLHRLAWKRDLLARIGALNGAPAARLETVLARAADGEDVDFIRVVTDCPGLDHEPYLRLYALQEGVAGWRIVSRCRIASGRPYAHILVDRGFIAEADAPRLKADPAADRPPHRAVVGLLRSPGPRRPFAPEDRPEENVWFSRDILAMEAYLDASGPAPVFLMLESPPPQGFGPTPAPLPAQLSNRHLGYALTWFGLAAALAGVWLAYVLRGRRSA